ncbi:hypothetical protein AVEN_56423-1 [Araneus ventricosus]|uniref:Uncharacterized protein n=1 Tax=Araneus ventricosus TaxID=182803 RepID=A0A4Y2CSR2_ARAVE|nr:hypothetical protein AVEN_56423-1 [Araneus ventricosus]
MKGKFFAVFTRALMSIKPFFLPFTLQLWRHPEFGATGSCLGLGPPLSASSQRPACGSKCAIEMLIRHILVNRKRNPKKVLNQPLFENSDCVAENVWNSFYPRNTGVTTLKLGSCNPCEFVRNTMEANHRLKRS